MFRLREEIDKLLEKYPDPRRGTLGLAEFHTKQENKKCYPKRGIVWQELTYRSVLPFEFAKQRFCKHRIRCSNEML